MWYERILTRFTSRIRGGQVQIKDCPWCGDAKYNCEISIDKKCFHCWKCNQSGTAWSFMKHNGMSIDEEDWQITKEPKVLPKASLLDLSDFKPMVYDDHKEFLMSRGLGSLDVPRYNLLLDGTNIIIPLYENGTLVYFVRRSMVTKRYKNPTIPKQSLLPYFLGKRDRYTFYICEGVFDALSVHKLGFTSAPLLGTVMSDQQIQKYRDFGFKRAVVTLDGDAFGKGIDLQERLEEQGIDSYIVKFDTKEDPNEMYMRDKEALLDTLLSYYRPSLLEKVHENLRS